MFIDVCMCVCMCVHECLCVFISAHLPAPFFMSVKKIHLHAAACIFLLHVSFSK